MRGRERILCECVFMCLCVARVCLCEYVRVGVTCKARAYRINIHANRGERIESAIYTSSERSELACIPPPFSHVCQPLRSPIFQRRAAKWTAVCARARRHSSRPFHRRVLRLHTCIISTVPPPFTTPVAAAVVVAVEDGAGLDNYRWVGGWVVTRKY